MSEEEAFALADPDKPKRHPFWEPRWYDDQHCCEAHAQWGGHLGSHYHCPTCWAETGMNGHHTTFCKVTRTQREFHRCCPDDCELAAAPDQGTQKGGPLPPGTGRGPS